MLEILENPLYVVAGAGLLALVFAFVRSQTVNRADPGPENMQVIAGHIREGAMAFLQREYRALTIFVVVVAGLLAFANMSNAQSHWLIALSFVVGAFCSGLAGFIGMRVATAANVRTAAAARTSLNGALGIAFSGGSVMGMAVVGLGTLGLTLLLLIYMETSIVTSNANQDFGVILNVLAGFSLGASSIALFARVGGGIYTKAADVGADLVGKVEAGIPEDDPRNPATIADNVGDNVGDVAGMGADLFESYVGSIIGAMILGWQIATTSGFEDNIPLGLSVLPLVLAAIGIASSVIGTFFVRTREGGNPQAALHFGTLVAAVIMIVASYFTITNAFEAGAVFVFESGDIVPKLLVEANQGHPIMTALANSSPVDAADGIFFSVVAGLVVGTLIGLVTEYFTSDHYKPVQYIASQSNTGAATNIIAGTAVGMLSTAIPVLLLAAGIAVSFSFAGVYGVAIAALGMLSTTGIQLAVDAYGPIADNAGGIAEMAKLDPEVRERTDKLDAVGNTTAAIGKGFAIGSAALTALALFSAFMTTANIDTLNVMQPTILCGMFVGAMLPFVFSALSMLAVGRAAGKMIEEVRRQFREIPGLLEGNATADYKQCVDISTAAAMKEMVLPGMLALVVPVVTGLVSLDALGGLLVGVTVSGVLLALFQSNAGGAWDNAKKYVEGGHHGGKGSEAHKAAVTGDTVGDPYKDTAGPSLNILIKLISVLALVLAPTLVAFHQSGDSLASSTKTARSQPAFGGKRVDRSGDVKHKFELRKAEEAYKAKQAARLKATGAKKATTPPAKVKPTPATPTTTAKKCPTGCKKWFDGCNTCDCKNGALAGCTKKVCAKADLKKAVCVDPAKAPSAGAQPVAPKATAPATKKAPAPAPATKKTPAPATKKATPAAKKAPAPAPKAKASAKKAPAKKAAAPAKKTKAPAKKK